MTCQRPRGFYERPCGTCSGCRDTETIATLRKQLKSATKDRDALRDEKLEWEADQREIQELCLVLGISYPGEPVCAVKELQRERDAARAKLTTVTEERDALLDRPHLAGICPSCEIGIVTDAGQELVQQRDQAWEERDAARAEVERVTKKLGQCFNPERCTCVDGEHCDECSYIARECTREFLDDAHAEVERLRECLNHDQTGLAVGMGKVLHELTSFQWLADPDAWGSYEWEERSIETLRREIGDAFSAIREACDTALSESGRRACAALAPQDAEKEGDGD